MCQVGSNSRICLRFHDICCNLFQIFPVTPQPLLWSRNLPNSWKFRQRRLARSSPRCTTCCLLCKTVSEPQVATILRPATWQQRAAKNVDISWNHFKSLYIHLYIHPYTPLRGGLGSSFVGFQVMPGAPWPLHNPPPWISALHPSKFITPLSERRQGVHLLRYQGILEANFTI
jgi:hypothetical protein